MDDLKHDIEKYLKGELSEAKMHALEKRALDDPFLADALEGAAGIEDTAFTQDMASLGQKLSTRVSQKKVIPLWIWPARIAAGLLVIAAATYTIISLQEEEQPKNIAYKADEKVPEPSDIIDDTVHTSPSDGHLSMNATQGESNAAETESASAPPAPEPMGEIAPAKPTPEVDQPIVQQEARRDEIAEAPELQAELEIKSDVAKEALPSTSAAPPVAREEMMTKSEAFDRADDATLKRRSSIRTNRYTGSDSTASHPLVIRGRVTSVDDEAGLPGVNVMIKGSSTGTVTDIRGDYQLSVDDPTTTLVFSFIGMESKEVPVDKSSSVNVSLSQDVAQLSEVVVVGYGENKEEDQKSFPTFDMAEPAGGKRAFKKYLEDKMVYPQEALDHKIEGRVTVQFTIETSGQISDLNVIKGIGYGCDDEVIRLIKEGPRWTPMKRDDEPVKGRVRVRMRFTLPGKK